MKHGFFILTLAPSILIGCSNNTSSAVKFLPPIRGGTPGGSSTTEKTLPPLKSEDRLNVLFNEMNRVERVLRNVVRTPTEPANSCTKYVSTPTKRGVFLVMTYQRCGYTQEMSGRRGKYVFQINGNETYEQKASRIDVRAQLNLLVGRFPTKKATMRPKAAYELEATGDEGVGKTKSVEYTSTYGNEKTADEDFWVTTIEGGKWIQTGDEDLLAMAKGTSVKLVYRTGSESKSRLTTELITELILKATDEIKFAKTCPWPVSGSFEAQIGRETPFNVNVSASGYSFEGATDEIKWPTNHCLGVKQNQ